MVTTTESAIVPPQFWVNWLMKRRTPIGRVNASGLVRKNRAYRNSFHAVMKA